MKRIVVYTLGLAVLVLVVLIPAAFSSSGSASGQTEDTTITSYVADFTVDEQGDLTVVETLTVDVPGPGTHGIFRFFDIADPNAPHARRIPNDIAVTRDGEDEPFEMERREQGRIRVARIGSASATLTPGRHVYEIRYAIDGVLEPGTDGARTQFYWNLIPGGWQQPIAKSDLTVHLPVAAEDVRCALGVDAAGGCTARGEGTDTLHVATGPLEPNTPVTVKAGLDLATPPAGETRPWTVRFDPVLGPGPVVLAVVLVLAAGAAVLGSILGARSREPKPGYPLMYAPPEGIGPAQAKYIFTEQIDHRGVRRDVDARCREGCRRRWIARTTPGRSPTRAARRAGRGSTRSRRVSPTCWAVRAAPSRPPATMSRPASGSRTRSPPSRRAPGSGPAPRA